MSKLEGLKMQRNEAGVMAGAGASNTGNFACETFSAKRRAGSDLESHYHHYHTTTTTVAISVSP